MISHVGCQNGVNIASNRTYVVKCGFAVSEQKAITLTNMPLYQPSTTRYEAIFKRCLEQ